MMKKNLLNLLLVFGLLGVATSIHAKRRTRRAGKISAAFEQPSSPKSASGLPGLKTVSIAQNNNTPALPEPPTPQASNRSQAINSTEPTKDKDSEVVQAAKENKQDTVPNQPVKDIEYSTFDDDSLKLPTELQKDAEVEQQKAEQEAQEALQTLAEQEEDEEDKIDFQFEDADLQNFVKQTEELFDITFITDDMLSPAKEGSKVLKGNKISFITHAPLQRAEAWSLFITFLEIAGFAVVPTADSKVYRIQPLASARKAPIRAFIGVDAAKLPDSDEVIRYVYFIENSTVDAITNIVSSLKSPDAPLVKLNENKAFMLTDKAYNIKVLMNIVKELDKVSTPQSMSILKLRRADADQVKKLYDTLAQSPDQAPQRPFTPRRQPTALYFPENTRIIAEPRTNSLILLGSKDAISKIEEFIVKYIDIELDQPYSPLYVYQLKYADATTIAEIMNNLSQFGQDTAAGQSGGVRGPDKYLKNMTFTAEKDTNRLIIKGQYDDYLMARDIVEKLDEQQPQVAMEVLILSVSIRDQKELGTQIRSKIPGLVDALGQNVKFQTSGLRASGSPSSIVTNPDGPGVQRLLGNLLELVTNAIPGNTILTFGQDMFDVWGLLQMLQSMTNLQVISNPFVVATNKTPATVSLGQSRRVVTSTIVGTTPTDTFGTDKAELKVDITPQINSDGMIILELTVDFTEFNDPNNFLSAEKTTRKLQTKTILADREVLALGGLVKNTVNTNLSKTPILGDVPLLGWLFKNKSKVAQKENLLILISTRIIRPHETSDVNKFTQERVKDYHGTLDSMADISERRDPVHKLFFEQGNKTEQAIEDFIFERGKKRSNRRRRRGRKVKEAESPDMMAKKEEAAPATALKDPQKVTQTVAIGPPPMPIRQRAAGKQLLEEPKKVEHSLHAEEQHKVADLGTKARSKKRARTSVGNMLCSHETRSRV